ncbi:MAG TPA: NADH-quinone oxidoreductase subunit M [Candidatus Wallbacteria bacterium]|nr:NADH-quinone oxidoreductase subunit M [Candidatus Wallbacteria bacterium]
MTELIASISENLIIILLAMPLFSFFFLASLNSLEGVRIKKIALVLSLVIFTASLCLYGGFNPQSSSMQFYKSVPWIASLNINFSLGVDGLSLFMVLLATLLTPIVIMSVSDKIENPGYYMSLFFLLEFTMIGTFCALDIILFYLFWELMLVPMYLIIGAWGGKNRIGAALRFFLFTAFGSVFMLWGILWITSYFQSANGSASFDILQLTASVYNFKSQCILFWMFSLAFMVKVPLFPLHTWLPHAHVEAPTGGSVMLAAVLLKMGTYGFLRFSIPMFPEAAAYFAPSMMFLGAFGVLYGSLMSYAQTDLKKLIAYSSVAHLGAIVAGIFSLSASGVSGSIIQMINHGISTGALFLLIGMIYERRHTRQLDDFGGIAANMPFYSTLFAITSFSSIGLPGLNGFIGEFMILAGVFSRSWTLGALTASGVIIGAVYMLSAYEKIFLGSVTKKENATLHDLSNTEKLCMAPLVALMFAIGIYPGFISCKIENAVKKITAPYTYVRPAGSADLNFNEYSVNAICQKKK